METKKDLFKINDCLKFFGPYQKNNYKMPTKTVFGRGALRKINEILSFEKYQKILLIVGEHFKLTKDFKELLDKFCRYKNKFFINEKKIRKSDFETINQLVNFGRQIKPDLLIAIGGGTVLDTSKCIALLLNNEGQIEDYVKLGLRKVKKGPIPLVAVPTTAGTGSEVTPWATVWDTKEKKKYSLASLTMFPFLAIVDSALTDSLSPKVTAESGFDALAQAIESYWSINHNSISDKFALQAIKLAMKVLPKAVNAPDKGVRDKMAKASLLAGLAFSNTQTTICHAVSYPITAFFDIPHGQAVAVTFPLFLRETIPALEKKRRIVLLKALRSKNEKDAQKKMKQFLKKIGLFTNLSQLGIKKSDLSLIVKEGFHPDRAKNAPRVPTSRELLKMLEEIY